MIGYSSDGVNWTAKQVTGMWLYGVAYGNGKYIAVGGNESISYICYSTDDVNWTTKQVSCRYLYGATYGNGKYIVMGDGGYIAYSTDGINWTSKIVGLDRKSVV